MFVAVKLLTGLHENVFTEITVTQTAMRPLHALDGPLSALKHDDHQIHVTVPRRFSPGVRAEKVDRLWLKLRSQPFNRLRQLVLWNGFHA